MIRASSVPFRRLAILVITAVATFGLGVTVSGRLHLGGAHREIALTPPSTSVGVLTAEAARKAAQLSAKADAFNAIATCRNDTSQSFRDCATDVENDLDAALTLAEDQYQARLNLLTLVGDGPYDPQIDPQHFSANITNPYLPFVVGRTLVYEGQTADGLEHVEVTTLNQTDEIDGVECRAVHDVVTVDGEVVEDTIDWFAQDDMGNVWYFGELSKSFDNGFLDNLDGSFRAGVEGAKPGIAMRAATFVGDAYRQEFFIAEAEDYAQVLGLNETVTVPYGTFTACRKTLEGTPLEPGAIEHKWFAAGVGLVRTVDLQTGETSDLIQIIN